MYRKDVDIGSIIKRVLEEKNIKKTAFARLLGYEKNSRKKVYSILNSKSIDTHQLIQISEILNYPFLDEYAKEKPINRQILQIETKPSKIEEIVAELSKDKSLIITKLTVCDRN